MPADPNAHPALCPSRRAVLCSLAAIGGVATLAACSGSGSSSAASGAGGTVPASEVPVGGAVVKEVGGAPVVLAQPTQGDFVGFSAICTHQGGTVQVDNGLIVRCPLHGSEFNIGKDGAVVEGPATEPLPSVKVSVSGSTLDVA